MENNLLYARSRENVPTDDSKMGNVRGNCFHYKSVVKLCFLVIFICITDKNFVSLYNSAA
jgi:hypothetical protein